MNLTYKKIVFEVTLFLFFFAPFLSLLIFNVVNVKLVIALPMLIRDFLVLFTVFLLFVNKNFTSKYIKLYLVFLVFIFIIFFGIVNTVISTAFSVELEYMIKGILNNIRRFVFIFVIFFFFLYVIYDDYRVKKQIKKVRAYLYVFWIFGLITYFLPDSFWYKLKLHEYWASFTNTIAATGQKYISDFQVTGKMYTHDTYYLFGTKMKRLISFYLEPTTTASLAIASVFFAYLFKYRKLFFLSIICGFLTFSKAFLITTFLFFLFLLLRKVKLSKVYLYSVVLGWIVMLLYFYFLYVKNSLIFQIGAFNHLVGIFEYINHFKFFGYGIGLAGSFSIVDNLKHIGIESSLANIVSQLGIPVVLVILFYWVLIVRKIRLRLGILIVITYIIIYSMSNSATGYSGNFLIMFLIAFLYKIPGGLLYEKNSFPYASTSFPSNQWRSNKKLEND